MNKIHTLFLLSFILIATTVIAQIKYKNDLHIVDARNAGEPKHNPKLHKHHDVELFRTRFKGQDDYIAVYYQKENDSLILHKASYCTTEKLNKARYTWLKDTLAVQVYNDNTDKEIHFKAYGHGESAILLMDEE